MINALEFGDKDPKCLKAHIIVIVLADKMNVSVTSI